LAYAVAAEAAEKVQPELPTRLRAQYTALGLDQSLTPDARRERLISLLLLHGVPGTQVEHYARAMHYAATVEDFVAGCIFMDPRTPHGDRCGLERLKYIHRLYDYNEDGVLDFAEFCTIVRHVRTSRGLANARAQTEVETEAKTYLAPSTDTSKLKISLMEFITEVREERFRGTSALFRSKRPIAAGPEPLVPLPQRQIPPSPTSRLSEEFSRLYSAAVHVAASIQPDLFQRLRLLYTTLGLEAPTLQRSARIQRLIALLAFHGVPLTLTDTYVRVLDRNPELMWEEFAVGCIMMDPRTPHDVHDSRKGEKSASWGMQRLRCIHMVYDLDGDGVLNFAEFCTMVRHMHLARAESLPDTATVESEARGYLPPGMDSRKLAVTVDEYIEQVEKRKLRGTSSLLRTKRPIGGPEIPPAVAPTAPATPSAPAQVPTTPARVVYDKHIFRRDSTGPAVSSVALTARHAVPGFTLNPVMDGELTVRGDQPTQQLVLGVLDRFEQLIRETATEPREVPHQRWRTGTLLSYLLDSHRPQQQSDIFCSILEAAMPLIQNQGTVVKVNAPAKVYGDVHGQLRDLVLLFNEYGMPFHRTGDIEFVSYVFNGDWVDRGPHQIETVLLMFCLKLRTPNRIWLVRGNHEDYRVNPHYGDYGYEQHCLRKFGNAQAFEKSHEVFSWLPLACVISDRILVVHGGIGKGDWTLDQLAAVKRPLDFGKLDPDVMFVYNILWSDPVHDDKIQGVNPNERDRGLGHVVRFGADITKQFCQRHGLELIIRSHECITHGFEVAHGGHLITVFSARNYVRSMEPKNPARNDGAVVFVTWDDAHKTLKVRPKAVA
jgi:diadenosine tetraphosphatase ApaH/serine/threonine PP2A family protein phosphatase